MQWWKRITVDHVSAIGGTAALWLGLVQFKEHNKQQKGSFLVQVDSAFMANHAKTQVLVEEHVRSMARIGSFEEFNFGSTLPDDVVKVERFMPGLQGKDNFKKRRDVLDYAAFMELVFRLYRKDVIDLDDISHMYKYRIETLVAHPYVFQTMMSSKGYKGLRELAFTFLSKDLDDEKSFSKEEELARRNICRLYSKFELDSGRLCLCSSSTESKV
jgi:hypothetical protein